MPTITIPRSTRHATTPVIDAQIAERYGVEDIDDGVAAGIAAGWQAPRGYGLTFAHLVSHVAVPLEDLLDAIRHERQDYATRGLLTEDVAVQLDMLATWAINRSTDGTQPAE